MFGITLTALATLAPALLPAQEGPPGLVLVKGGEVTVGTDIKDAMEMIKADQQAGSAIAGETPQHKMELADFYLMSTEVTNEQYAAYVRATGSKPPHLWAAKALDDARQAHVEEQGKSARAASQRGERYTRIKFDGQAWWNKNWESAEWEVPEDLLAHPVTYVDYQGAVDYAKWAGLRLMSEYEFYRAARGDSDRKYPWGDKWESGCASTFEDEQLQDGPSPVGSYPDGAVGGVYDLVGNVWEWTASPYVGFEGYKRVEVKMDRNRTIDAMAPFDPTNRVLVSGAFSSPEISSRISTRMATHRGNTTDALGFRCAASQVAGLDAAVSLLDSDIKLNVLPEDVNFSVEGAVVARNWKFGEGTAKKVKQLSSGKRTEGMIESYAVIEGYDQVLFVPATKMPGGSTRDLETLSQRDGPVHVGFLSTTIPIKTPALEPGTYHVAWRAGGKPRKSEGEEAFDWTTLQGFDQDEDQFLFLDLEGTPLVASNSPAVLHDKIRHKGSVKIQPYEPPSPKELRALESAGEPAPEPLDTVLLNVVVNGKSKGKGFLMDLPLLTDPSVTPKNWLLNN